MNKQVLSIALLIFGFFAVNAVASTVASSVPDPFQRYDEKSILTINYADLDSLLEAVVLNTGRSDRKKVSYSKSQTGTRMKFSVNRATVNEGNRFYFEAFENSEENQQTIRKIRNRLESIPGYSPLEKFTRDEQLAYWINLYNITMVDEIIKVYPARELEDLLEGKNSILAKKILTVAGIPLSLNDIQFTILQQNYDNDPLIVYGLYQGIIGGPNIRKSAYTGKFVYGDLIDNAMEFINSNRGTESKNEKVFRVSSLYARNQSYFDDFQADLTEHLLSYLEGEQRAELRTATKIKTDISDWTVTDLYGSSRDLAGGLANSNAALMGAMSGGEASRLVSKASAASRYSPEVVAHLNELNRKRLEERTGVVTIEEMGEAAGTSASVKEETLNNN